MRDEDDDDEKLYLESASTEQLIEAAWRDAAISYKLHPHQLRVYQQFRAWERNPNRGTLEGSLDLLYAAKISRRWGKTFLFALIKIEDALRNPGSRHTYACAWQKDIGDIIAPIFDAITADAPEDIQPKFQGTKEAEAGGYYFKNGSVIKLVGIDTHPRGLRGRASDGFVVSEAGFIRNLEKTVREVIYPQFLNRAGARMILESSQPEDAEHDFDRVFVCDAKDRGAYAEKTIEDFTTLDPEEKERFFRGSGGRQSPACRREYFNELVRVETKVVVPEFLEAEHVQSIDVPRFADCYVSLDPGMRDLCAILWGFWDFEHARLVIQRDFAERNASTARVADVIKRTEAELWSDVRRWTGRELKSNPALRVSDTDLRLIYDLTNEHGLDVAPVSKSTGAKTELREAAVHSLRAAIGRGQVFVDPACRTLISHLNAAQWNEQRTDYQRSEIHGHYDCLDALVYMWRSVDQEHNARPPGHHGLSRDSHFFPPEVQCRPLSDSAKALDMIFGSSQPANQQGVPKRPTWKPDKSHRWKRR